MSLLSTLFDSMVEKTHVETKAQDDSQKWIASSVRVFEGGRGQLGGKPWPFNYRAAMVQAQSWVYAAAFGNARTAAAIPLRLYVRGRRKKSGKVVHPEYERDLDEGGGAKELQHRSRAPKAKTKKYLQGGHPTHRPSMGVQTKVMAFGEDFQEVTEHPLLELFRRVNPYTNGFQFDVLRFACQELTGNFYMHPVMGSVRGHLQPLELYPMLPHWVEVKVAQPDDPELIQGYVYGADLTVRQDFSADEVIHFKYPNPRDLIYGLGKVEAAWSVLHLHHANRQSNITFFENNARPDFLVIAKPGTTSDQMDRFDSKLKRMGRGAANAAKFLTITGDVDVKPMQFSPKDQGTRDEDLEELAAIFGYPITKFKGNDPNRSNAAQGDLTHMKDTIHPMLCGDEETLNQFFETFDEAFANGDAVFAYDDPVPANRELELSEATAAIAGGWKSIDEQRLEDGMEPIGGPAAEPLVDASKVQVSKVGQAPLGFGLNFGPTGPANPSGITIGPRPGNNGDGTGGGQPDPDAPEGGDQQAQNIVPGEKLNGAQITAAKDVLEQVAAGLMAPKVGVELITAAGVNKETAQRMVDETVAFTPTPADNTVVEDDSTDRNLGSGSGNGKGRKGAPAGDASGADVSSDPNSNAAFQSDDLRDGDDQAGGTGDGDDLEDGDPAVPARGSAKGSGGDDGAPAPASRPRRYKLKLYAIPPIVQQIAADSARAQAANVH